MNRADLCMVGVCVLAACSGGKRPRAEPAPIHSDAPVVPTAAERVPVAAPAPVMPAEEQVPTQDELPLPEDFAAEAMHQITATNFRAELRALEKEMNAEN